MTHCSNCNAILKEGTKFCTKCGTAVQRNETQAEVTDNHEARFQTHTLQANIKKPFPMNKVLLGIGVLVILFFVGKYFLATSDISEPLFDIDEEVAKIEGKWHDPTGVILNDKSAVINFESVGSLSKGEDKNSSIYISMIPVNKNRYYATVILYGVEGEFDATYYPEENKLVFFSTLTKSSWNIKKLKK